MVETSLEAVALCGASLLDNVRANGVPRGAWVAAEITASFCV